MPASPLSEDLQEAIRQAARSGLTKTETAKQLHLNFGTVGKYWPQLPATPQPTPHQNRDEPLSSEPAERDYQENGDQAVLRLHTSEPVRTLEDAIRVAQVDLTTWYVERFEVSDWTVPVKLEQGQDKDTGRWKASIPLQTQQYRVKVFLRRIVAKVLRDAIDLVFARLKTEAPRWPKIERERASKGEPCLAVFGLFDVHFGKLCWQAETNSNYDLKIAETIFRHAVEDLLAESAHRVIGKIILPLGNDWLHIDNRQYATTRGTRQDTDGRFSKVFAAAKLAAVWAVETLAAVAPVQVVWVPGNHDQTLSEMLCHIVEARFHRSERVEVDVSPPDRKYVKWGSNLLGLTHGDKVAPPDLPNKMATEVPVEWAGSTCREWLIGHQHRSRKWVTKDTDTFDGTTVRVLRSLAGTDAWHYEMGYVGCKQAAEVYFYRRERGYAGHAVVSARM